MQSVYNYSTLNENRHKQISKFLSNQNTYQGVPIYGQNSLCLSQFNSMAQHNRNGNNTRTVQGGLNSMFSGNIFGGTFNKNVENENSTPPKKRRRIIFILTANKCFCFSSTCFNFDPLIVCKQTCIVYCVRSLTGIPRIPVTVGL